MKHLLHAAIQVSKPTEITPGIAKGNAISPKACMRLHSLIRPTFSHDWQFQKPLMNISRWDMAMLARKEYECKWFVYDLRYLPYGHPRLSVVRDPWQGIWSAIGYDCSTTPYRRGLRLFYGGTPLRGIGSFIGIGLRRVRMNRRHCYGVEGKKVADATLGKGRGNASL